MKDPRTLFDKDRILLHTVLPNVHSLSQAVSDACELLLKAPSLHIDLQHHCPNSIKVLIAESFEVLRVCRGN